MWIFLNDVFLSIVATSPSSEWLLVRSRFKEDIKRVFPDARVTRSPKRDYLYRAKVDRELVALTISNDILDIDYHNFKGSVKEKFRHDAYLDVWTVMHKAQRKHNVL